jgi:hypothetical protein
MEDSFTYLGSYAACEPWAARLMFCDHCMVSWTGCWDNFLKMKTKLPKVLLAAVLCCCHAQAGTVVEELTAIAAAYEMKYAGVNDYMGKAYYRFVLKKGMDKTPQEVYIPADVQGRREEELCFQSGVVSAFFTSFDSALTKPPSKTRVTH